MNYNELRLKYKTFIYDKFEIEETNENIHITFYFEIPNLTKFNPTIDIPTCNLNLKNKDKNFIEYIVFHIGLVELISYWKCACPKDVIINAGYIDNNQINFFKKLYYYGLGEFFYTNKINTNIDEFMNIKVNGTKKIYNIDYAGSGNLIPIGGGKDSCVTLEILKNENNSCFIINPKEVTLNCAKMAGYDDKNIYGVKRIIDKNLIELNKQGYLNGHTPFSAIVAFLSYLIAYLSDKEYIVLSNEASANESNVKGTKINHQYSKTYEFENDFNNYTYKYFKINIKYFSLLRPLLEYQIGMLFSKYKKYHPIFKSCNVGSKGEKSLWCSKCPKCLFVYLILSPFLYKKELIDIFESDLFEDKELLTTFIELLGYSDNKPFECVGTYEEANYAISNTITQLLNNNQKLPFLLDYYYKNYDLINNLDLEHHFNKTNNLNEHFIKLIKDELQW